MVRSEERTDRATDSTPSLIDSTEIPKPKGTALFRRFEWILSPVTYLERTKAETPDFFVEDSLGFGMGETIVTSHPEAMQFILSRDRITATDSAQSTFKAPGEFNRILSPFLGEQSVIMISDQAHKQRRHLIAPAFHGDRLHVYGQLVCQLTSELVATMNPGDRFVARTLTQQISLQTIAKVVFGSQESPREAALLPLLTQSVDSVGSPVSVLPLFFDILRKDLGPWSPWGRFLRRRAKLDELVYAEIEDRRNASEQDRTDILSMLMAARTETDEALSDVELRDELMALLLAGHETTATAMAWAMYWLHAEPRVKEKLLAELDAIAPDAPPTEIASLPYLTAVVKETLRRSPVTMFTFPRIAQTDIELMGHCFPAGTAFLGCMFLTHQREELYPDYQAFRPERFLERKFSPYEFIPFGSGARRCVGEALAQYEMKLAIATLLKHHRFKLASDQPEKPRRRGVTLSPSNGVPMIYLGER